MLILQPNDVLRIVTGAAADIEAYASYVDAPYPATAGSSVSVERVVLPSITTATTTQLLAGPAAATRRNVKHICITNNHATASSQVGVEIFDGSTNTVELREVTLLPGENLALTEGGVWRHRDAQNAEYTYQAPADGNLGPAGTLAETFPRALATTNSSFGASGTLAMQAIYLTAGQLVSNITMFSATTAAATTTNLFFALYDSNRNLLAQSANQGAYVWAANTIKTLAMVTPYRVPVSGVYYVAVLQVATTIATLLGGAAKLNAVISSTPPVLHGSSTTGLTNTLPNPAAVLANSTISLYAAVS